VPAHPTKLLRQLRGLRQPSAQLANPLAAQFPLDRVEEAHAVMRDAGIRQTRPEDGRSRLIPSPSRASILTIDRRILGAWRDHPRRNVVRFRAITKLWLDLIVSTLSAGRLDNFSTSLHRLF
jgi:hypothetical protein